MNASELSDIRQRAQAERLLRIKAQYDAQAVALASQLARCEAEGLIVEEVEGGYQFNPNETA
jgi:hypothetical protein